MYRLKANIERIKVINVKILMRKLIKKSKSILYKNESYRNKQSLTDFIIEKDAINLTPFLTLLPEIDELLKYRTELQEYNEKIINHQFDLLGSGLCSLNVNGSKKRNIGESLFHSERTKYELLLKKIDEDYQVIDWNVDFVSGYRWDENTESSLLKYGDARGVEVKIPWELGRLQHLISICYSSVIADEVNNRYLNEFQNQVIDFIISNPKGYGIQWKSTMDVSIRVINLIFCYVILKRGNVEIDASFEQLLLMSITEHSHYIYEHLEWNDGLRGNHYFFNISGLLISQLFIVDTIEKSSLLDFAFREFCNEIMYQFHDDGGNFEASLPYHYFASEAVFICEKLINLIDIQKFDFPLEVKDRIQRIRKFTFKNINASSCFPQIGDNDSGYLLRLHPADIVHQIDLSASHILRDIAAPKQDINYDLFPDFGLYVNRTNDIHLTFRCGALGQRGKGGHAHNDQLSITLDVANKPFFADSGTFCYTSNPIERNKYRSAKMHNTMSIDGKEQNLFFNNTTDDLFWMFDKSKAKVINASATEIHGIHCGYGKKTERKLKFLGRKIYGTDKAEINDKKYIHFHLHPHVSIIKIENGVRLTNDNVSIVLEIENNKFSIDEYHYSPGYGKKVKSQKIVVTSMEPQINWTIKY